MFECKYTTSFLKLIHSTNDLLILHNRTRSLKRKYVERGPFCRYDKRRRIECNYLQGFGMPTAPKFRVFAKFCENPKCLWDEYASKSVRKDPLFRQDKSNIVFPSIVIHWCMQPPRLSPVIHSHKYTSVWSVIDVLYSTSGCSTKECAFNTRQQKMQY